MSNDILISVIIPVYNAEKTLAACLESIKAQSFESYEIILVDDGSSDGSCMLCDSFSDSDDRISVFHTENKGAAAARNYGVKKAAGEFIAFVDSDDTVDADYLSYLYELSKEYDADIAACACEKVYADKNEAVASVSAEKEHTDNGSDGCISGSINGSRECRDCRVCFNKEDAVKSLLYQRHFMSVPWGMISKRLLWDTVQFPEGQQAEDMATIYKLFAASSKVAFGDRKLYKYYQRATNTMFSTSGERNKYYFRHCDEMTAYIREHMPACINAALSRFFSACFQILSETPHDNKHADLLRLVYDAVKNMRSIILKDKDARLRNRVAAALSYVSIRMLHAGLRAMYVLKRKIKL